MTVRTRRLEAALCTLADLTAEDHKVARMTDPPVPMYVPDIGITLSAAESEKHIPGELPASIGPAIWCKCGVSMHASTERGLSELWRAHLLVATGALRAGSASG